MQKLTKDLAIVFSSTPKYLIYVWGCLLDVLNGMWREKKDKDENALSQFGNWLQFPKQNHPALFRGPSVLGMQFYNSNSFIVGRSTRSPKNYQRLFEDSPHPHPFSHMLSHIPWPQYLLNTMAMRSLLFDDTNHGYALMIMSVNHGRNFDAYYAHKLTSFDGGQAVCVFVAINHHSLNDFSLIVEPGSSGTYRYIIQDYYGIAHANRQYDGLYLPFFRNSEVEAMIPPNKYSDAKELFFRI